MVWLYLLGAIAVEVCATTSLKMSDGFADWRFSLLSLTLYGISFWLLSLTLRVIPISTAYAIWSGLGTGLVAIIGILFFKEPIGALKVLLLLMIIGGVVGLKLIAARH